MEKINPTSGAADTPEPKAEKSAADSFYCYIGPGITGLIQHGDICRGTRKKALAKWDEAIKKYPLIKTLIVSGDKLPEARLKVKKPGNALYKNYQRILGKA
ncbi:MAG: hypothetical protein K1W21_13795 [Oscillospiraceae bacterium]|jgi:hypothetical protein